MTKLSVDRSAGPTEFVATAALINIAAADAGNWAMRRDGRRVWSVADKRAAVAEHLRLSLVFGMIPPRFRRQERARLREMERGK